LRTFCPATLIESAPKVVAEMVATTPGNMPRYPAKLRLNDGVSTNSCALM
jgi:hypothetical protein